MAELKIRIGPEDIASRVVNEVEYKGRTIAEWVDSLENPKEKADRIRSMSDEELAWMYAEKIASCYGCESSTMEDCAKCWLDWLKQEGTE